MAQLIEEMEHKGPVSPGYPLHLSTAYRVLKKAWLSGRPGSAPVDRRRFEAEFSSDIWQADVMHGPQVVVDGKKRKSYLIAFLDDLSRLIPQARFPLSENLAGFLTVFRGELTCRGLPRKLYVDNDSAFRSRHLEKICACLGIASPTPRLIRRRVGARSSASSARCAASCSAPLPDRPWRSSIKPWTGGFSRTITAVPIPPPANRRWN